MDKKPSSSKNSWRLRTGITTDDIETFAQRYRNSSDEKKAIKDAYVKGRGCMDYILEHVICTTVADEPRIRQIIGEMIEQKTVPAFEKFTDDSEGRENRKRKAAEEALESKRICQEMGGMTERRTQNFSEFCDYLEAKYKDDDCSEDYAAEEEETSEDDSDLETPVSKKNRC